MAESKKIKILFVCSGNICRSPLAHKLFENIVDQHGCGNHFEVDSCGTGAWHMGANADERMRALAQQRGWKLDKYSRRIHPDDFIYFDYIFVMDKGHLFEIKNMAQNPGVIKSKVRLFREFDASSSEDDVEVPDPYYGGIDEFENVYNMVERTCGAMFSHFQKTFTA